MLQTHGVRVIPLRPPQQVARGRHDQCLVCLARARSNRLIQKQDLSWGRRVLGPNAPSATWEKSSLLNPRQAPPFTLEVEKSPVRLFEGLPTQESFTSAPRIGIASLQQREPR